MFPLPQTACPLPGALPPHQVEDDSPEFFAWLADSSVHAPVYHVTDATSAATIEQHGFNLLKTGSSSWYGNGVSLLPDPALAKFGTTPVKVAVKMKNPLQGTVGHVQAEIDKLTPPGQWSNPAVKNAAITQALKDKGYDGITVHTAAGHSSIVAFDESTIKIVVPKKAPAPSPSVPAPAAAVSAGGVKPIPGSLKLGDTVVSPTGTGTVVEFQGKAWVKIAGVKPAWQKVSTLELPPAPTAPQLAKPKPVTAADVKVGNVGVGSTVITPEGVSVKITDKKGNTWVKVDGGKKSWYPVNELSTIPPNTTPAIAPPVVKSIPPPQPAHVPLPPAPPPTQPTMTGSLHSTAPTASLVPADPKKVATGDIVTTPTGKGIVVDKKGSAWVKVDGVSPAWQKTSTLQVEPGHNAALAAGTAPPPVTVPSPAAAAMNPPPAVPGLPPHPVASAGPVKLTASQAASLKADDLVDTPAGPAKVLYAPGASKTVTVHLPTGAIHNYPIGELFEAGSLGQGMVVPPPPPPTVSSPVPAAAPPKPVGALKSKDIFVGQDYVTAHGSVVTIVEKKSGYAKGKWSSGQTKWFKPEALGEVGTAGAAAPPVPVPSLSGAQAQYATPPPVNAPAAVKVGDVIFVGGDGHVKVTSILKNGTIKAKPVTGAVKAYLDTDVVDIKPKIAIGTQTTDQLAAELEIGHPVKTPNGNGLIVEKFGASVTVQIFDGKMVTVGYDKIAEYPYAAFDPAKWPPATGVKVSKSGFAGASYSPSSYTPPPAAAKVPFAGWNTQVQTGQYTHVHQDAQWLNSWPSFFASAVTSTEKSAVQTYTGSSYSQINRALRDSAGNTRPNASKGIDGAMAKGQADRDMMVYRGASISNVKFDASSVGKVFTDHGYMSTAIEPAKAWGGLKWDIQVPAGTPGLYVDSISRNKGEKEFLLPRGTSLQIMAVEQQGAGTRILAKVVATGAPAGTPVLK